MTNLKNVLNSLSFSLFLSSRLDYSAARFDVFGDPNITPDNSAVAGSLSL
jgi:hypothetical protein